MMLRTGGIARSFDSFFVPKALRKLAGGAGPSRNHREAARRHWRPGRDAGQALDLRLMSGLALLPERGNCLLGFRWLRLAPPPANFLRASGVQSLSNDSCLSRLRNIS